MTAKLLTGMSSLAETENKNNNIQTTKHKQNKTKNKSNHTKKNAVRALQPCYLGRIQH